MRRFTVFLILGFFLFMVLAVLPARSASAQKLIYGCTGDAANSSVCKDANNSKQTTSDNAIYGPKGVLTKGAGIITYIGGIAAVIMIILGAFTFMTSGSEPAKVAVARKTILYAVVGLVVLVIPSAIIRFIISRL